VRNIQLDSSGSSNPAARHTDISIQVPALLSRPQPLQLIDSTTITSYLIDRYPSLCPAAHRAQIEDLLAELHEISYVTLTFKPEERRVEGVMDMVREIQARPETSERYRRMLGVKLEK
jgi:glutathione S-transferase